MGQNIILLGTTYEDVPSITLPKVGGGTAKFIDDETAIKNYVHGEFHTNSTSGVQTVEIPYSGTGYPIMLYVCIKGGAHAPDTTWHDAINRYAIGTWAMSKSDMSLAPTFQDSSSIENLAVVMAVFKNSTSDADVYSRTSSMIAQTFTTEAPSASGTATIRIRNNTKTLSVYVAGSSYGLFPDQDYEYFIVYSS